MNTAKVAPGLGIVLGVLVGSAQGQEAACPRHAEHQAAARKAAETAEATGDHHAQVDHRHDEATGVAHTDSVHHFVLGPRGGTIQLEATQAGDREGRDRIRRHLSRIAASFARGRFDLPMLIHDQTPPGVEALRRLGSAVAYHYAPTPRGGRVEIATDDAEGQAAVHAFLRFQIEEHRTGDPTGSRRPDRRAP